MSYYSAENALGQVQEQQATTGQKAIGFLSIAGIILVSWVLLRPQGKGVSSVKRGSYRPKVKSVFSL